MNKDQYFKLLYLRQHYGERWVSFVHNKKNDDKVILPLDKFVLDSVKNFPVLAFNCLGQIYKNIINVDVIPEHNNYSTLILVNNPEFKYCTHLEIIEKVLNYSSYLKKESRIILNINFEFLIYDRISISANNVVEIFKLKFLEKGFVSTQTKFSMTDYEWDSGFGNLFLILDRSN
jgi:hypothetical protein